jgi:hypothetical protein
MPNPPRKRGPRPRPHMTKSEELRLASEIFWSLVDLTARFLPAIPRSRPGAGNGLVGSPRGRPRFKFNHRTYYARRFAWTLSHGEPEGLLLIDPCGNRNCVRHLGTRLPTENLAEATMVNRYGEQHANAKPTDQKVRQIRAARAAGTPRAVLARRFKVSPGGHQPSGEPTLLEAHLTPPGMREPGNPIRAASR